MERDRSGLPLLFSLVFFFFLFRIEAMKQSIFFDLDGTLWDAIKPIQESWNETVRKEGYDYHYDDKTIKSTMGLTPIETLPITFPHENETEGMRLFQACVRGEISYLSKHPGELYPKERETLAILSQEYPLYIVSNSDKGYVENFLSACHMEPYFKGHVCAGDTGLDKWQNILYLKKNENVDKVIYLGDTLKDKKECEKAKVPFIHAKYGFGQFEPDECYIETFSELPEKAKELFEK